ncbi:DUF2000 domain-containing protein [Phyllobacterium chamaecytisi]|uniref:DUF2000 domain-containing protein n=1 Tax=Phyllobacterium chamaecytisi TaxID=2876082 RepID=UPI001CCFCF25|nr:DUF2000 domain-containing protein [Phyllobacterium sp. KW56]MBZ9600865.1 DUF2000 domain-containing protein [Phyllobacterium sp. KW56]
MLSDLVSEIEPGRCAIVVDQSLPVGRAANAAAVIALTMGKIHPELAGVDLIDGSGLAHPGLIPIGISVLGATAEELKALREKATSREISVVDFPIQGQQTNDYSAFGSAVALVETKELSYVGVGLYGSRKVVGKIVGKFGFLK